MDSRREKTELKEQFPRKLNNSNSLTPSFWMETPIHVTTLEFHRWRKKSQSDSRRQPSGKTLHVSASLVRCEFPCLDDSLAFQLDCTETSPGYKVDTEGGKESDVYVFVSKR